MFIIDVSALNHIESVKSPLYESPKELPKEEPSLICELAELSKSKLCGYAETASGICQFPELSASQFADWSNLYQAVGVFVYDVAGTPELYMFDISVVWSLFQKTTLEISPLK